MHLDVPGFAPSADVDVDEVAERGAERTRDEEAEQGEVRALLVDQARQLRDLEERLHERSPERVGDEREGNGQERERDACLESDRGPSAEETRASAHGRAEPKALEQHDLVE